MEYNALNPFHASAPFLYKQKTLENLRFSGGKEMGHWRKTGLSLISNNDHKVSAVGNKNN